MDNKKKYNCPKCGNTVNQIYNGLCNLCYSETADLFELNTKDIRYCKICNDFFEGLKTIKTKYFNDGIIKIIKSRIILNNNFKKFNLNIEVEKINENYVNIYLNVKAISSGNIPLSEDFMIPFKIKHITCVQCSKKNTDYFEAILQIRNRNDIIIKKVINELNKILKIEEKRSVFATNFIQIKNGVDVYITSQKHIKDIGKKLYEIFGGEIKINEQLFSKNHLTSKNLYRINLLLRIPDFEKNSIIKFKDKLIYITSIKGNFLLGLDLINNKNIKTKYNLDEIELIQEKPIITELIKTNPNVEVLNPFTFQNEQIMNPNVLIDSKNKIIDNKINVVIYNNLIWVIMV
jgi:nonsense-mediated mRNA decay protein 3